MELNKALAENYYPDPPLKWAGGKRWIIPHLEKLYDPSKRLVDPFVGGLSVPLGLKADRALISDVNPHLMNFHMHLRRGFKKEEIDHSHIRFLNHVEVYYQNRDCFNALAESRQYWTTEGALLFYYLNRTGFNGLCRFNKSGKFNVPFGQYQNINYQTDFSRYYGAMSNWELMYGDFESLPIQPDDFIYADPPYDVEFTQFAQRDFTWSDQERLAKWLARHKGPVVASNQATPRILELYRNLGFSLYSLDGPRRISCNGDRTPAQEMFAVKMEKS